MRSIRYSPVLQALPPERLAWLLRHASDRDYPTDERITLAAEPLERVYLVDQGVVKLIDRDVRMREAILALLVPGDLLGDIEAVDGSPALFESAAATPCRLIAFERAAFVEVVERSPRASLEVARSVATRTRAIATNSIERHGSEARVRIAARLLDLAELLGHMRGGTIEMEIPMSQEELGRLAGMCRESACRAIGKLRSEGVLELKGRKMRILKPDVLEHIRCGAAHTPVS